MQVMRRGLALLTLICLCAVTPALADTGVAMARAMGEMRKGDWNGALSAAGKPGSVARDVIEWHRLRAGHGSPAEVTDFLARRGNWPGLDWLRRKSEPQIIEASHAVVRDFFAEVPPQTPAGVLSHARALVDAGKAGDAEAGIVLAWRTLPMSAEDQAAFLADHAKLLAPHHAARLDWMLWDDHVVSAQRMLPLVGPGERALAEARITLQENGRNPDGKIAAVPEALRDHPGLARDRFEWRIRKGLRESATELLLKHSTSAKALGHPAFWAGRRVDLARRIMRGGDPQLAYRIASSHFTTPEAGYVHADLEWLSGFLALRFLNDPAAALLHFQTFDKAIESPISKGRAGYWIGRAQEALGNAEAAQAAYAMGAEHQTSFYGLLAAERAGIGFPENLVNPPDLPPWRDAPFMNSSVLKAGLVLLAANEPALGERFLTHLVENLDPVQARQLGNMAIDMKRPHLAVMIAKRAARQAEVLEGAYYPLHPLADLKLPMAPEMNLAIARRESEFDPTVVSGAGARGLMQVMPATARLVASDLGILASYDTSRLTEDWEYNAKLGANYLAFLAGELQGNVIMMSAGYNAGPGRPRQWMEANGDPRGKGEAAMVDWIELIPFNETRNYVMRVSESLPVYRARLGKPPLPIPFSAEIEGSTLLSFAP
jgi:soluble lytic murein transglycosylase